MKYSEEQKKQIVEKICAHISDGKATRKAIRESEIATSTFWLWIDADKELSERYARAISERTDLKFESIEADYSEEPQRDPETGRIDTGWVQLQRLKIDAKKWELAKLQPKKYGERIDVTSGGDKITAPPAISINIVNPEDEE